mmetsp:Transcript_82546/g.164596  ORF Transcript_82546/g.164596 Transcript_82546/m.164596 type:complete len:257 (-) Transcript_82546:1588-2358(-)
MATLTSRRAIKIRRARLLGWCWVLSSSAARRLPVERASAEAAASRACWVYSSALGVFTLSPTPSARASCSCLRLRPRRTTLNPAPYAPCDRAPLCPRDAWVRVRVLAHILPTCSHKGCLTVQSSIEVRSSDSCSVRPLPPQAPPLTPHSPSSHTSQLVPFWRQMFLPPGYPHTMVESYASYQLWARLETAIGWPRDVVLQMITWQHLYGVGDASATPASAVYVDIFMQSVATSVALLSGLPLVSRALSVHLAQLMT